MKMTAFYFVLHLDGTVFYGHHTATNEKKQKAYIYI